MSMVKAAVSGMVGFAMGAGMMLMPGNQKLKRRMQCEMEKLRKIAKMW